MNELDEQNLKYWKYGLIYNNPNDPDLLVRKPTGLGWTLNFAHSQAYFIIGGFLVFAVLGIIFALIGENYS